MLVWGSHPLPLTIFNMFIACLVLSATSSVGFCQLICWSMNTPGKRAVLLVYIYLPCIKIFPVCFLLFFFVKNYVIRICRHWLQTPTSYPVGRRSLCLIILCSLVLAVVVVFPMLHKSHSSAHWDNAVYGSVISFPMSLSIIENYRWWYITDPLGNTVPLYVYVWFLTSCSNLHASFL